MFGADSGRPLSGPRIEECARTAIRGDPIAPDPRIASPRSANNAEAFANSFNDVVALIIFVSAGGDGDVVPLLRLGTVMRQRGHIPALISHARYTRWAEAAGWITAPITSDAEWHAQLQDVLLLAKAPIEFLRRYFVPWNRIIYRAIQHLHRHGATLLVSQRTIKVHADVLASAHLGVPLVQVAIVPGAMATSGHVFHGTFGHDYAALCATLAGELGLQPWGRGAVKPSCLGLWDRWFLPDRQLLDIDAVVGFVKGGELSPPLAFADGIVLSDASRPLLVFIAGTLGTVKSWARRLFELALVATERLSASCLLLGGSQSDVPAVIPEWASWRPFASLADVLPRSSAVVHHAGIGTAAEAMRAGVPQLAIPRVFSQDLVALRLENLGVSVRLLESDVTVGALSCGLEQLLRSGPISMRCREVRTRFLSDTRHAYCDALESVLSTRRWHGNG